MDKKELLGRCFFVLNNRGLVRDKKDFASQIGFAYTNLSNAFSGKEKYLTDGLFQRIEAAFPNILTEIQTNDLVQESTEKIPVIPTSARGGSLGDFAISIKDYDCEFITSPIKGATYAIQVTGDSMAPEYPSGCHVLIKRINEEAFIEWGKVYVLDTENGSVIKQVRNTDNPSVIECVSLNPAYPPFTIDTKYIHGWYRVLMVMSLK